MKTFVYVISGDHGRQKIGSSDNPKQRIRELQTASPFPLKFEFIGEVEDGAGGQVEVEAHFTLNAHKAPGGDEWFVVPPDVAITAVMAAAHRLGYRIKPVDASAIGRGSIFGPRYYQRQPLWVLIAMSPLYLWFAYWVFVVEHNRMMSGEISLGTGAIEIAALALLLCLVMLVVKWVGNHIIATHYEWAEFLRRPKEPS